MLDRRESNLIRSARILSPGAAAVSPGERRAAQEELQAACVSAGLHVPQLSTAASHAEIPTASTVSVSVGDIPTAELLSVPQWHAGNNSTAHASPRTGGTNSVRSGGFQEVGSGSVVVGSRQLDGGDSDGGNDHDQW